MVLLHQRLGPHTKVGNLTDLSTEDMSQYDPDEGESQNIETFPILDEEPKVTLKWGEQYVYTEILLPRGDEMARGSVLHWKCDADGNPIGRSTQNHFLNT